VIDCLMKEATLYGVQVRLQVSVESIHRLEGMFKLQTKASGRDETTEADAICIAAGGSSKTASYDWIRSLGHKVAYPVPSLFTFNIPDHPITALMGVSLEDAEVKIPLLKEKQRGPLLITHWGLSGPAVLKLSAWCAVGLAKLKYDFSVLVNWAPDFHESGMRDYIVSHREQFASVPVKNKNPFGIAQRLWEFLLRSSGIMNDMRWADLPAVLMNRLARNICSYELKVSGKTTFKEEFVTAGGVNLSEIDPNTMMSRIMPGLFFAGEIMDVDGITGGYNFQHAWTSGFLAAKAIAGNVSKTEINQLTV